MFTRHDRISLPVLQPGVAHTDGRGSEAPADGGSELQLDGGTGLLSDRERELLRDGWTRRFIAAPPRLGEMIELYRSLGLEVRDEPLDQRTVDDECTGCFTAAASSRIIFTRVPR
jgi:hypothetical protein